MKAFVISAFVTGAMVSSSAFATEGDGTITFNGALTATTCTINGNNSNSKDFTVQLPTVSTSILTQLGDTAGDTGYPIVLSACAPVSSTSKASVFYQAGATVDPTDGRLIVAPGGAGNVKLEILNADGTQVKAGYPSDLQNSKPADISSGGATLNYIARYYAIGATSAGVANSSVIYSIDYQ
jgi:major type 1 subunit fimbrin (pilin)